MKRCIQQNKLKKSQQWDFEFFKEVDQISVCPLPTPFRTQFVLCCVVFWDFQSNETVLQSCGRFCLKTYIVYEFPRGGGLFTISDRHQPIPLSPPCSQIARNKGGTKKASHTKKAIQHFPGGLRPPGTRGGGLKRGLITSSFDISYTKEGAGLPQQNISGKTKIQRFRNVRKSAKNEEIIG